MARNFVRASSQYLTPNGVTDLTSQMSFGCWFKPASTPGADTFQTLLSKGKDGNDRNYDFDYRTTLGVPKLELNWTSPASTFIEYYYEVTLTNGTWYHLLWTMDWGTNPDTITFYLNGVSQGLTLVGSNNGTPSLGATQSAHIGAFRSISPLDFLDGDLAELFITRDIVTAAEAASLAAGFSPLFLLGKHTFDAYYPLIGRYSPETDPIRGNTATLTNAPTSASHPRVIMPRPRRTYEFTIAQQSLFPAHFAKRSYVALVTQ